MKYRGTDIVGIDIVDIQNDDTSPNPPGDDVIKMADKNGIHLVDVLFHGGRNTRQRS